MKIDIKDVSKVYDGKTVLNDITLNLNDNETLVLIGKSGSGKSTLLRLMSGIEDPSQGNIKINDHEVNTRDFKDKIGFVFQTGSLFGHLTMFDNINVILEKVKKKSKAESKEIIDNLLKQFDLYEHKDKYPHMLSGGQQQRASIVRSLAVNAEIFFFDEPTSALDPILTNEVLKTISKLRELGKKFVVVTHEIGFARQVSDYVVFLDEGEIIEQGSTQILDNPKTDMLKNFLDLVPH